MRLVLFEFGPDQKLEVTQDVSLKCLAQISLDSAVLAVRPAIIYEASAAGGSHLPISVLVACIDTECCVSTKFVTLPVSEIAICLIVVLIVL